MDDCWTQSDRIQKLSWSNSSHLKKMKYEKIQNEVNNYPSSEFYRTSYLLFFIATGAPTQWKISMISRRLSAQ